MRHVVFGFALLLFAAGAAAQPFELRNPNDRAAFGDAVPSERYGTAIAVDGATAAVGSFAGTDARGNPSGAVRIYARQGDAWILQAKLSIPGDGVYDAFGSALALHGDALFVGAPHHRIEADYTRGAVFVFAREAGTWRHVQTLAQPFGAQGAYFGGAIALDGDTLAVGATQTDAGNVENAGNVTLFRRGPTGWHAQQILAPATPSRHGMFGAPLAFANGELLVGAPGENLQRGALYTFMREDDDWLQGQRLTGGDTIASDGFGRAFAANAQRLLVGAPAYLQARTGAVIEFRREAGAWIESRTLSPPSAPDLRHFGIRVVNAGGDAWAFGAERRPLPTGIDAVEVHTYAPVGGMLSPVRQVSVDYQGRAGYALEALVADGGDLLLGLPFAQAAPWSDAGRVVIVDAGGGQVSLDPGATASGEHFGASLAVVGSRWLFAAAPGERRRSGAAGAVYAYDLDAFDTEPSDVVLSPDRERGDAFGHQLATSADTLLVSALRDDVVGSVQAFEHDGVAWQRVARWTPPNAGEYFGAALAADAQTAVVAAPYEDDSPGSAYVYRREGGGWAAPLRLTAAVIAAGEVFGEAVAVDGDTIAVGSVLYALGPIDLPEPVNGSVHVYERSQDGWSQVARLTRPADPPVDDEPAFDDFGVSVAIAGDTLFASAPRLREVQVFRRQAGQWQATQRIAAPSATMYGFGRLLRVLDGELWISSGSYGAAGDPLYRYAQRDGIWRLVQTLRPPGAGGEQFGGALALAGDIAFIGVPRARGHAIDVRNAGRVDGVVRNVFGSGFDD